MSTLSLSRRSPFLVLSATALVFGASCAGEPESDGDRSEETEVGSSASPLMINPVNPHGALSIVAPPEGPWVVATNGSSWRTIQGTSAVAYAQAGDSLDIGFSAEIQTPGSIWMRAVVDGVVASPSDVFFKGSAGSTWDGVRSFHFVATNLTAGPHVVEIQWYGHASTQIRDRSLAVHTGNPASADSALAVVAAPSGASIQTSTTTWTDIPGLQTTITSGGPYELQIGWSGEVIATSGQLLVRAIVDGAIGASVRVTEAGSAGNWASRSFNVRRALSGAGVHTVKLQWATTTGGNAYMGDRTLTAFTGPNNANGGSFGINWIDTTVAHAPGTTWADVPSMNRSFNTSDPSSTIAFTASAEASASPGRLFLRAIFDGKLAEPSDVTLVQGASTFAAYQYTFQQKNVPPGAHTVQFQAMRESGTTASILDRSVSVVAKRRGGGDFAQPRNGPIGIETRPRVKSHRPIVICLDPKRPDPGWGGAIQRKLTPTELRGFFQGTDGGISLKGWWTEVSAGRVLDAGHTYVDCVDAPLAHQGSYYWTAPNGFVQMHQDALTLADATVDFHSFDTNGDGTLSYEEATVYIVKPQLGSLFGQTGNGITLPVDGGQTMTIEYVDLYMNPDSRSPSVGVVAHESAHTIGTWDLYGNPEVPFTPRTIMSMYEWVNHLDPEHKLRSGFLMPDVIEMGSWTTQTVTVAAVETSKGAILIYDRARPLEYFILENRWADVSNYDGVFFGGVQSLPAYGQDGLVIWRVVRDDTTSSWGAAYDNPVVSLNAVGESYTLQYRDGTLTKIRVTAQSGVGQNMTASIEKLP